MSEFDKEKENRGEIAQSPASPPDTAQPSPIPNADTSTQPAPIPNADASTQPAPIPNADASAQPAPIPNADASAQPAPIPNADTSAQPAPTVRMPYPYAAQPAHHAESTGNTADFGAGAQAPGTPPPVFHAESGAPIPGGIPAGGAVPFQPYPYGVPMPNPYTVPAPNPPQAQKRRMPTGLRVLLIVMSVLLAGSVIGFASFGVYTALTTSRPSAFSDFSQPSPADPGEENAEPEVSAPALPDIEVVPNTEGIALNSTPTGAPMSAAEVYNKVLPSTVLVVTTTENSVGTGTGIFATEDGYIITNSHVVLNSKSVAVQVKTNDGAFHDAVVVGYDKTTDLAVLKIEGSGYTPAEFGNSDELVMGQEVLAIGNPGGEQFSGSLTGGIVSGLNRSVGEYSSNGMTYIQTDAAINPGNSGGPLVNMYGQVIGINSAKIVSEQYEGMGFAIPTSGGKAIIDDLLSGGYVQGRVRFGIKGNEITEMQASMYSVQTGFMIQEIDADSSFNGTDVQVYDIITAVDGVETPTLDALSDALLAYGPGDTVTVSLFRPNENGVGGEAFEATVTLLEDKGETQS